MAVELFALSATKFIGEELTQSFLAWCKRRKGSEPKLFFGQAKQGAISSLSDIENVLMSSRRIASEEGTDRTIKRKIQRLSEHITDIRHHIENSPLPLVEAANEEEQRKINDAIALFNLTIIYYSMSMQTKGQQIRNALEDNDLDKFSKYHAHFRELFDSLDKIVALRPLAPLSVQTAEILVQGLTNINVELIGEIDTILNTPSKEIERTLILLDKRKKATTNQDDIVQQVSQEVGDFLLASGHSLLSFNDAYTSFLDKYSDKDITTEIFDEVLFNLIVNNVIHGVFLKDNINKIAINPYSTEINGITYKSTCEVTNKSGGWYEPYFGCENGKVVSDDGFGFFGGCKLCGKKRKDHVRIW
ncbi:MAG: hypothetical protein ACTSYA_05195 [Candidatus Kariarchaeaceae archaeon]